MRPRVLRLFAQVVTVLCIVAACLSAGPKPKPTPKVFTLPTFPDKLVFIGRGNHGHDFSTAMTCEKKGDGIVSYDAITRPHYLCWGRNLGTDFLICSADVREGDLLPLLGHLYRVTRVYSKGGDVPAMKAEQVPPDKRPPGTSQHPWSLSIPPDKGGRGGARLHDARVSVKQVLPPATAEGRPTARLLVIPLDRDAPPTEAVVSEGDVVLLHKAAQKVWSVVPPDPKTCLFTVTPV